MGKKSGHPTPFKNRIPILPVVVITRWLASLLLLQRGTFNNSVTQSLQWPTGWIHPRQKVRLTLRESLAVSTPSATSLSPRPLLSRLFAFGHWHCFCRSSSKNNNNNNNNNNNDNKRCCGRHGCRCKGQAYSSGCVGSRLVFALAQTCGRSRTQ
jgi:hypothetical protein